MRSICGHLRTGGDFSTLACFETVDDLLELLGRQVFEGVLEDHDHRRVDAGALTFDFFPGKRATLVQGEGIMGNLALANLDQVFGATQHAGRRTANLNVGARADRLQLELGVEGRNFERADVRHAEHVRDRLDGGLRDPAVLVLSAHQQRDDGRLLTTLGVLIDRFLRPGGVLLAEGKARWLDGVFG
jgi:hypothetical protein